MSIAKVHLMQGVDRRKTVRQAVEALGSAFVDRVKAARQIFIKVNLVRHDVPLAVTHVDAVRGLLDVIRLHSAADVYVGDGAEFGTKSALHQCDYGYLLQEYQRVAMVDLNDDVLLPGHIVRRDGSLGEIRRSKLAHDCDVRISLAPMKTDRAFGVSLSVENWAMGTWIVPSRNGVQGQIWSRWPWVQDEGIAALHASVAQLFEELPCHFAVLDGMMAMEGNGPIAGNPVPLSVALAGMDALAVDAVGATLMGYDPQEIGYLVDGARRGLGTIAMSKIDVPPLLIAQLQREFVRPT